MLRPVLAILLIIVLPTHSFGLEEHLSPNLKEDKS